MTDFRRPSRRIGAPVTDAEGTASRRRLAYAGGTEFQRRLRERVDVHFSNTGSRRRDNGQWYLKAALILLTFTVSYMLLVFVAETWWQVALLSAVLALSTVGIGFNIMHDGGHAAISRYRLMNRLMAHSLDVVGGSSYLWRWKHGVLHHNYSNISGHDTDIAIGVLARLSPHQPRYAHQRWQHWYIWLLYGLMAIKWHFFDDFRTLLLGKIGPHRIPRPRGAELVMLVAGKLIFFVLAFGVPLALHPVWVVALVYVLFAVIAGFLLSIVFQLAHCVEEAEFPLVAADALSVENSWAVHQVETTVNFCRGNGLITWLLGGLNYQIEHHLFPEIGHCNYPGMSAVVRETCEEFGVRYNEHASFWSGLCSHFRWLRRLGAPAHAHA